MFAALLLSTACNPGSFDRVPERGTDGAVERASDASAVTETPRSPFDAATSEDARVATNADASVEGDARSPGLPADADAAQRGDDGAVAVDRDASVAAPDAAPVVDAGPPCFSASTSLISYLPLDGSPLDAVPPQRGGAQVSGVSPDFGTGRVGGSLRGGELAFLQSRLDAPTALTISAWVKLDEVPVNLNAAWLWKGDTGGDDLSTGYWLVFASNNFRAENARYITGVPAQGHLGLGLTNGTEEQFLLTDRPFPLLRFMHVVATFDGTRARLYLDGHIERDDAQRVLARATDTPVRLASPLGGSLSPLSGELDEVVFFDRALSPSEVSELYARSGVVCTQ